MKLKHPESKATVESTNPEAYLSQGWVEATTKKADDGDEPPAK